MIKCLTCGKSFVPEKHNEKYCSSHCRANRPSKYCSTQKLRFKVLKRDCFKCYYCGRGSQDGVKLHVDHIIPQKLGGVYCEDNLITSCDECNQGKKADELDAENYKAIKAYINEKNMLIA